MKDLQKIGGIAALIHAAAYLVDIGMYFTLTAPIMDDTPDNTWHNWQITRISYTSGF